MGRRYLRTWLTGALTVLGAVTTLATSESPVGTIDEEGFLLMEEVWSTSVVMAEGESAGQLFMSFPLDLLEDHHPQMEFRVSVSVDRIEHTAAPGMSWSVTLGDLAEPAFTFTSESAQLEPIDDPEGRGTTSFHQPWEHIMFQTIDPIIIVTDPAACTTGACVPCDGTKERCEPALILDREGSFLPRVQVEISGHLPREEQ